VKIQKKKLHKKCKNIRSDPEVLVSAQMRVMTMILQEVCGFTVS